MNAAALQEDPKEIFSTYTKVMNGLLVAYHSRYPLQPLETLVMVWMDIAKYTNEMATPAVQEGTKKDLTLCSIFQAMGEDLAVRIGAHSAYQEAIAQACAGCMSHG